jgi:hypothetical protein
VKQTAEQVASMHRASMILWVPESRS